ncbi:RNA polymerase sigma factor [Bacillus suaedaesalsae]|uniref:RNA polymerase sigma factor n=1 Tax=Bacillus suaedaesalsae TaxID=2810349 RepID=A0ABS2DFT9_9BACI|nr:RNA polymerase sigma factor [Bacillus suaedaesalsae]MBM6616423.1 RNA polymerase sigma factor [Bacillus suaedaesalsae]
MEEDSVTEWFHLYEKDVTSFLVYYTGSLEVEDIVQETFLIAIKKIAKYEGKSSPKTWLISIARNLVIDQHRRKKVWNKIKHILQVENADTHRIEENAMKKLEQDQLYRAIEQLSSPYKEVVILRGILELSSVETSEVLTCSSNKVNVMYHRALKKLKGILEKEGFQYGRSS